ncbi:MAG: N-acetylmuramoyl-L-alanine amidase, partial [Anaerolineae bacterium]|nr:N-acetylmuramoyl-L-alanine amidase [Anaerolineae bacterium]
LGAYVEPVHLQIVCRQLWDNLPPERDEILGEDLARLGDVDQALIGFYEDTLQTVLENVDMSERRLRNWFDNRLITPARTRGLVYRSTFDTEGLSNRAIDVLNEAYIIRANKRGNDTWYELAHDRLVEPILAANHEWLTRYQNPLTRAAEDWQNAGRDPSRLYKSEQIEEVRAQIDPDELTELENEFIAACGEAARAQQAKRVRLALLGGGILLVIFALLTIWSINSAVSANRLNAIAEARWWSFVSIDNLEQNPDLSVLLSIHAMDRISRVRRAEDTIEPENALHRALHQIKASGYQYALQHRAQVAISSLAFSPDGQTLGTAADDGTVYLWDVDSGSLDQSLDAHAAPVRRVAFSLDGTYLATAGADQRVVLWDAQTAKRLAELIGHNTEVYLLAFSPDSQYLATADAQGIVKVWQTENGELLFTLPAHTDAISNIVFSPDGTRLATASADKTARVWNVEPYTGDAEQGAKEFERALFSLSGHTGSVNDITFSPNGKRLATASADKTARLWNADSGAELFVLLGHSASVSDVAFSPDGKFLATASADGTAKVWDTGTGREQTPLAQTGPVSPVRRVTFSPDGTRLAAASENGTVRIWSQPSGKELYLLSDHQGNLTSLAFSSESTHLASAGADGAANLYTMDVGMLLDIACDQANRNLTFNEWQNYIGTSRYQQTCPQQPVHDSAILEFIRDRPGAVRKYVRNGWLTPRTIKDVSEQQMAGVLLELAREHITKNDVSGAMVALEQARELVPDLDVQTLATIYASVCALARPSDLTDDVQTACTQAAALAVQTDSLSLNENVCQSTRIEALAKAVLPACQKAETLKKTQDLAIEFIESPNFSERPPGTAIHLIVVGATKNDSLSSTTLEFQNPQALKSAHYAIDKDGKIVQYVAEANRAWHTAKSVWQEESNVNDFSIAIELVNLNDGQEAYPVSQRQALLDLCVSLASKYDLPADHVVGRNEISQAGETDPAGFDIDQLRDDVDGVLSTLNSYEQAANDTERLLELANLFALGSVYTQEALNRFYSLEPAQQISLFPADASTRIKQEIEIVIRGVYLTLDRMEGDQDLAIMQAMIHSLQSADAQGFKGLTDEISYWKEARELDDAGQYKQAVSDYDKAVALNGTHPVILFDRAIAYLELEQYDKTLDDLSQVYRLAAAVQEQQGTTTLATQVALPEAGTAGIETQQRFTNPARVQETVQTTIQEEDGLLAYLEAHAQAYPSLAAMVAINPIQAQTIFGLHDPGGEWLMEDMGRTGWIVFPERLMHDPNDFGSFDYSEWADAGLGVIVRIDHDYFTGGTIPRSESYDDFAQRVRNFVQESDGAHIWVLGNEPNSVQNHPDKQPITPDLYAECYKKVWDQIHNLPGHADDQLVVAPIAPWNNSTAYRSNENGDWVQYFVDVLNEIQKQGVTVDAIALHTYTHGADPGLITSEEKMERPFQDRRYQFRAYRDFLEAIPPDLHAVPVYITETEQGDPWLDANTGWVQDAYEEIDVWNNTPGNQQIHALVLYRWANYDQWSIQGKKGVYEDFQAAMENDYVWADSAALAPEPGEPVVAATVTPRPTPTPTPALVGGLEIDFIESPNYNERPPDAEIWALIIHASASNSLDAFVRAAQNPQLPYSVHYVIDKDGRVVQMVDEAMRAWHSGNSEWKGVPNVNDFTIGIELINLNDGKDPYPRAQLEALVELCVELVEDYGIDS